MKKIKASTFSKIYYGIAVLPLLGYVGFLVLFFLSPLNEVIAWVYFAIGLVFMALFALQLSFKKSVMSLFKNHLNFEIKEKRGILIMRKKTIIVSLFLVAVATSVVLGFLIYFISKDAAQIQLLTKNNYTFDVPEITVDIVLHALMMSFAVAVLVICGFMLFKIFKIDSAVFDNALSEKQKAEIELKKQRKVKKLESKLNKFKN